MFCKPLEKSTPTTPYLEITLWGEKRLLLKKEELLSTTLTAVLETGPPVLQICMAHVTGTLCAQQGRGEHVVLTG